MIGLTPPGGAAPQRASHVADRLVDGELALYDPATQRLHVLNPTAGLIWRLCDGQHDQDDLVAALVRRYPESCARIEADVARLIGHFEAEGLLKK